MRPIKGILGLCPQYSRLSILPTVNNINCLYCQLRVRTNSVISNCNWNSTPPNFSSELLQWNSTSSKSGCSCVLDFDHTLKISVLELKWNSSSSNFSCSSILDFHLTPKFTVDLDLDLVKKDKRDKI